MMQQVMSNPQLMEQVYSRNLYFNLVLTELCVQMMRNHPLFANNPQAAQMAQQSAQMVCNSSIP